MILLVTLCVNFGLSFLNRLVVSNWQTEQAGARDEVMLRAVTCITAISEIGGIVYGQPRSDDSGS